MCGCFGKKKKSKQKEALECAKSAMSEYIDSAEFVATELKILIILLEGKEEDKVQSFCKLSADVIRKISNDNERQKVQLEGVIEKLRQMVPESKTSKPKFGEPRKNEYLQLGAESSAEGGLNSPRMYGSTDREHISLRHTKTVSCSYSELKEKLAECRAENENLPLKHFLEKTNQRPETMRRRFSSRSSPNLCASSEPYENDKSQLLRDSRFAEEVYSKETDEEYQEMTPSWLDTRLKEFKQETNREKKQTVEQANKLPKAKKNSVQLKEELENLQTQAAELEVIEDKQQTEIQNVEESNRQTENKLTKLEEKTCQTEDTLKQELSKLGERNTQLDIKNKNLSKEIEQINVLLEKAKTASGQLKQELENLQTQAAEHEGIENNLHKEIQTLEEKNRQTEAKLTNLKEETRQTEETLEHELTELGERNTQLEIENKKLSEEIDKLISQPACQVQVFSPSSLPMMKQMQTELVSSIQKRLDAIVNDIEVVLCESIEKLKQDLPILLLCMNVSRLGTDSANALHGLKPNSKMALVVFHHKDIHALPNQSSDRVLVDPTFKELGGIFDIAFLSEKGVYSCKMNEENISKITAFLLKLEQAK